MRIILIFAVIIFRIYSCNGDDHMEAKIIPKVQKVAENSPAVFTCISSVPNVEFTWFKGKDMVNEDENVSIRLISEAMSVLRIEEAHSKMHKGKYRCQISKNSAAIFQTAQLKIISPKRLHKDFPRLSTLIDEGKEIIPGDKELLRIRCKILDENNRITWRWIKDNYVDLSLGPNEDDERIEIEDDGTLVISNMIPSDSGVYTCVAENNRGTAYGMTATVLVENGPPTTDCLDSTGYRSQYGESYQRPGDPCTTCTCLADSTLQCRSISCSPVLCRAGEVLVHSNTTCCDSKCVPEVGHSTIGCLDTTGYRSQYGDSYQLPNDPCTTCTCMEDSTLRCRSISCAPVRCRAGEVLVHSNITCCDSKCVPEVASTAGERCTDRDGRSIMTGDVFLPEEDPCLKCVCDNGRRGRCMMVACDAPTCLEYTSSRDVCCNYTCLNLPPKPSRISDGCVSFAGVRVSNGELFQPSENPCLTCECRDGQQSGCAEMVCDEPPCKNYRLIKGTCCGFECLDSVESVEVFLDEKMCEAYDGTLVRHGEDFHPNEDYCVTCTCEKGYPTLCRSVACYPPPMNCSATRPVPRECCKFECVTPTGLPSHADIRERVLGRLYVQQVGSKDAIVQWKIPDKFQSMQQNLTVFWYIDTNRKNLQNVVHTGNRTYAILRDLDPNVVYSVLINGTLGANEAVMTTRPETFVLDGRGRPSLVLSDAVGQVFESRGSITYPQYSLPRKFEPIPRLSDVRTILNVDSFHRVDVSTYNESPCMNQDCGLLRFYMYTAEGDLRNVLSFMFTNQQDFEWAKAHL